MLNPSTMIFGKQLQTDKAANKAHYICSADYTYSAVHVYLICSYGMGSDRYSCNRSVDIRS